ncbi:hypothetical protein [Curvibacter gracilis]|uniref:hypothetical protein n=1 Tax=Curvibacter gracilis TaxID=230310 RepID=UPI001B7FF7B7|nr:hypothetical protein [Curvibacter gracilis]
MPIATARKAHFVQGAKHPLALDATTSPPVPCDLKLGDVVTFTNDFGVAFSDLKVTGFTPCVEGHGRFVYLDKDSWWFPVKPDQLHLQ